MDSIKLKLKESIIDTLSLEDITPDDIDDDSPLFVDGLGLDSVDALQLIMMLEEEFGIGFENDSQSREHLKSINTLVKLIYEKQQP